MAKKSISGTKMIQVTLGYRGKPTREQPIEPGVYAHDDSRLFGLAEQLIERGFAIEIGSHSSVAEEGLQEEISDEDLSPEE